MNVIHLSGCAAEPLGDYLKCLGVFRIIGEQLDPSVRLSWCRGTGCLHSDHTANEIVEFLLHKYQPTPILAPWNGGSGFYGGTKAQEAVEAIACANNSRFKVYGEAITAIRRFVPRDKPKDDDKQALLAQCRARLSDEIVPWLDVCFVLGEENPRYFPLLGTGGNDGRLDFTSNFMQRLREILAFNTDEAVPSGSEELLRSALFGNIVAKLDISAVGQFDPGAIGGPNATQAGFEGKSLVNAWDYVLLMEGCVLFAGAFARRNGLSAAGRAVFPFSVETVSVGYGSATVNDETSDSSRAELWLPTWLTPFSLRETRHLLAEGRAQIGRRQARNSVEFAMAINLLGVSRGIDSFRRFGFLKRNGLAFLATPLGSIRVQMRPQARLLEDPRFMEWLDAWRRATSDKARTPSRYVSALRGIDRRCYEYMARSEMGNDAPWLQAVLRSIGRGERTLSQGRRFAEGNSLRPLQRLGTDWVDLTDDGSVEFRLALSLASVERGGRDVPPLRAYVEPLDFTGDWAIWNHESCSAVWTERTLAGNLASVFRRRQLEAFRSGSTGGGVPLNARRYASLTDVLLFLNGQTDDLKLGELLWGLLTVATTALDYRVTNCAVAPNQVPIAFGALRLLVEPLALRECVDGWVLDDGGETTRPEQMPFQILASQRSDAVANATTRAAQRLRQSGHTVVGYRTRLRAGHALPGGSLSPERLLASMLFPLSKSDLQRLATSVLFDSTSEG